MLKPNGNSPIVVPVSSVPAKSIQWLWDDFIPRGALTLLSGAVGCGKSKLTYDLACRISRGDYLPHATSRIRPSDVILLEGEDCLQSVTRPTLEAMGGVLDRILVPDEEATGSGLDLEGRCVSLPRDVPKLAKLIEQTDVKFLVINPWRAFFAGALSTNEAVRRSLRELNSLAQEYGIAVLLVGHPGKGRCHTAVEYAAGSQGLAEVAHSVLVVGHYPGSNLKHEFVIAGAKSNLGTIKSIRYATRQTGNGAVVIDWGDESDISADELINGQHYSVGTSMLHEAKRFLVKVLWDAPLPQRVVLAHPDATILSVRTIHRAKKVLGIESRKRRQESADCWYWVLDRNHPQVKELRRDSVVELLDKLTSESAS